ncbi:MAG: acylphosphatase [Nanoarchaeota archaeon]|nr:acylphosphatase [Nanoarchaeota archaeon]
MNLLHAFVKGRVQGVFFRAKTKALAEDLSLKGWVMNLPDGRVEVKAEGDKNKLTEFLEYLRKGPKNAFVEEVEFYYEEDENFKEFSVRYIT